MCASAYDHEQFDDLLNVNTPTNNINGRTSKELATLDIAYQSLGIKYPFLDVDYELKSSLIHLFSEFHDLVNEDPNKHLKELHVVIYYNHLGFLRIMSK
ncbi:hypothetical protein CR513_36799, partial [Mucuna pruriens]